MPHDCYLTSATPVTRVIAEPAAARRTPARQVSRTGALLAASALGGLVLAGAAVWTLDRAGEGLRAASEPLRDRTLTSAAPVMPVMTPLSAPVMAAIAPIADLDAGLQRRAPTSRAEVSRGHVTGNARARVVTASTRPPSAHAKAGNRVVARQPQKKTAPGSTGSKRTRIASAREG